MGYTFVPPAPTLPNNKFPIFNVIEAMSEGVFQQVDNTTPQSNSRNALIPPSNDNVEKRPRQPWSAPQDDSPAPALSTAADPFSEFQTDWQSVDNAHVQALADLVAGAFGWGGASASPPPVLGGPPRTVLSGNRPDQLLGQTDFPRYYMSCPWITVS